MGARTAKEIDDKTVSIIRDFEAPQSAYEIAMFTSHSPASVVPMDELDDCFLQECLNDLDPTCASVCSNLTSFDWGSLFGTTARFLESTSNLTDISTSLRWSLTGVSMLRLTILSSGNSYDTNIFVVAL